MRSPVLAACLLLSGCATQLASMRVPGTELRVHQVVLPISNVHAIESPDGVVLVDTGDPGEAPDVLAALARSELDARRVRLIVVTHAHADHIGSARALSQALGAPVALQQADVPIAREGHNPPLHPTSLTAELLTAFLTHDFPALDPAVAFEACLDLAPYGIRGVVYSAPGHTPGSAVVVLAGGDAIVGDLFAGGYLGGLIAPQIPTEHYYQEHPRRVRAIAEWLLSIGVRRLHLGHGGPVSADDLRTALAGGDLGPPADAPFEPPPCEVPVP